MFKEKYRSDNELLKAPEKIPEVIINMANNPEKSTDRKSSLLRITAAAAAVCVLIAGIAALPFVLGSSRGVDTPLIETLVISPGDLHTAEGYDEIYDHITELNSYYYAGFGVLTDGAIMEPSAENMAPMSPTPTTKPATNGAVVNEEFRTDDFAGDALADDLKTGASGSGKDYSATNTQKENVDEADIIKTDGKYIYYTSRLSYDVIIAKVEDGKAVWLCTECEYKVLKDIPSSSADLDDVPKTGDISNQIVAYTACGLAALMAVAFVFKRKATR